MSNNGKWDAPDIVPSITYAHVPRAIEWLERVFGFRERSLARPLQLAGLLGRSAADPRT